MRLLLATAIAGAVAIGGNVEAMAIEEAVYRVVERDGPFEIRDYAPQIVAETLVEGTLEQAGNRAFGRLFSYISGANRPRRNIAMTAPVSQRPAGGKIEMTAPVSQRREQGRWAVSFTMPASLTLETLPEPEDPLVTLREVPPRRMAAVRYAGSWSERGYRRHLERLQSWMRRRGLAPAGEPAWARYNSPFSLWFLRRNEILVPVRAGAD